MKETSVLIIVFCLQLFGQSIQLEGRKSLEQRVKLELGMICYEECPQPLESRLLDQRLLNPADAAAISEVLVHLIAEYQGARPPSPEYRYLIASMSAVGKLRVMAAVPELVKIAKSAPSGNNREEGNATLFLEVEAFQAIGDIDPKGNAGLLLEGLKNDFYPVRYQAALGLSKTDDASVLPDLELQASREHSRGEFLEIQGLADALRLRVNSRSK